MNKIEIIINFFLLSGKFIILVKILRWISATYNMEDMDYISLSKLFFETKLMQFLFFNYIQHKFTFKAFWCLHIWVNYFFW